MTSTTDNNPVRYATEHARLEIQETSRALDAYWGRSITDTNGQIEDMRRAVEGLMRALSAVTRAVEALDQAAQACGQGFYDLLDPSSMHRCQRPTGHEGNHSDQRA